MGIPLKWRMLIVGIGLVAWGVKTFIKYFGIPAQDEGGYAIPFSVLRIVLGLAALWFAYRLYRNEE